MKDSLWLSFSLGVWIVDRKIIQSKGRFFVIAAVALTCTFILTSFLSEREDLPFYLVAAGNIALLIMTAVLIWSAVGIFRDKILFHGGENGLYINFPPVNRGTVPWKNIDRIECGQGNTLTIYLSGLWDGEGQFDIKNESGKRSIVLKLGTRAKNHIVSQKLANMKEFACPEQVSFTFFEEKNAKSNRVLKTACTAFGIVLSKFYLLLLLVFLFGAGALQNAGYFNGGVFAAAALLWAAGTVILKKRLKKLLKRMETAAEEDTKRVRGI